MALLGGKMANKKTMRTIFCFYLGGTAALGPWGSLAWEGEGMAPGYHWRLIGMVFCGCFFVFWWPVVLAIILLLFLWLQILCVSCVLS